MLSRFYSLNEKNGKIPATFVYHHQGQFNFAEVLIKPLDNASNMVTLRFKDELKDLLTDTGARVISDVNLPRLVRQLVVHINVSESHVVCTDCLQ